MSDPESPQVVGAAKVLVVREEQTAWDGLAESLRADNYAVQEIKQNAFVLADALAASAIFLPASDVGLDLMARVRADERGKLVALIFASTDNDSIEACMARGGDDCLRLPFAPGLLKTRVRSAMAVRRQARVVVATKRLPQNTEGLLQALEARDQLIRQIIHDLNNPLTNVLGSVDLMLMHARQHVGESDKTLKRLTSVRASAEDMATLITAVHELNLLARGERKIHMAEEDSVVLTREGIETFQRTFGDLRSGIDVELPDHAVRVRADRSLMPRVIVHLLNQSLKRQGADARLKVEVHVDSKVARVLVHDSGAPLQKALASVFEGSDSSANGDSLAHLVGIRLAFCKLAAEAQGSRLSAAPRPGGGTTFTLEMPRAL